MRFTKSWKRNIQGIFILNISDAGKITGMILDIGLEEMKILLNKREKLDEVILEAYEVINN